MKITREILLRSAKILVLSFAIGAVVGYFAFYVVIPSVVVPAIVNPSLILAGAVLFVLGLIVGSLSDDLEAVVIEVLIGNIIGALVGYLIFISPTFHPEIDLPFAQEYLFYVLHSALPLLIVSAVVLFISGLMGNVFSEHLAVREAISQFEAGLHGTSKEGDDQHKS